MKTKTIVLLSLLVFIGGGCSKKVWVAPPGTSQQQIAQDSAQCEMMGLQAGSAQGSMMPQQQYTPAGPYSNAYVDSSGLQMQMASIATQKRMQENCFRGKGYTLQDANP